MSQDQLSPNRLEAFSDGVIAVIITIMVLELKVPPHELSNVEGLRQLTPLLFVYLLSFIMVGIYWVNHHYMVDDVDHVTHGLLWANLSFLFTLSLIPFGTNWLGERGVSPFAIALYAICLALPAVSWFLLSSIICRTTGKQPPSGTLKQITSSVLYLGAIPVAYRSEMLAIAMLTAVAVLWLIPPREIVEKTRAQRAASAPHSR